MGRFATAESEEVRSGMDAALTTEWDSQGHLQHFSSSAAARAFAALGHLE
jgi:hypothetical protein